MGAFLTRIARQSDVLLALGVIVILGVMIVPLPTFVLDFFLTLNISVALLVLMLTIYIAAPLELSVFPGLLLVLTLFRLSLNVASTRLILSQADAGRLIEAFGDVVVRGNYIIGFIIFVIVIIIQFVVITRGAGRVAEVAARFTLDAMPGKQMAIDADLNAGLIDEGEARKRREDISREADFYGAMDGASKFVRGDAIAGILITLINIIGGFAIGVLQRDLSLAESLSTYTLLTVGDGLVTQIPALITSTAAGIIVTRAASDDNLGADINQQLTGRPQAGLIAGPMLIGLGLIPGLPTWPFVLIGVAFAGLAFLVRMMNRRREAAEAIVAEEESHPEERPEDYLRVDMLEAEIGYQLVPLVDASQGGDLIERIVQIRKVAAMEMGFIVPPVRVRDNIQLRPNEYQIKIKGDPVARGELHPKSLLAIDPGLAEGPLDGQETTDPAFGLPARWINPDDREKAELLGYNVVEPVAVLATHLTEVTNANAAELMGRQETQHLIDEFKVSHPAVVEELIPDIVPVGRLQRVLQNLLAERVPVRDFRTVLETLADYADIKDVEVLTEYVRTALRRSIGNVLLRDDGQGEGIAVLTVAGDVEELIKESVQSTPVGLNVAIAPDVATQIFRSLTSLIDHMIANGQQPVVLTAPHVRLAFRKLTASSFPTLYVLSYNEIAPEVEVSAVGVLRLDYEDPEIRGAERATSPATVA
ncbi:MAG: flagellar biosynthesis protein FlhA [Candidatus Latescibacterota bacterium]|nr:flagellar biosynthesis protein FlhA [Candidatus Latescibacterota bacterium]